MWTAENKEKQAEHVVMLGYRGESQRSSETTIRYSFFNSKRERLKSLHF